MDIKKRIISRKVMFRYFYMKNFVVYFCRNKQNIEEITKIEKDVEYGRFEEPKEFLERLEEIYSEDMFEDVEYIKDNVLSKSGDIDMIYVSSMISGYDKYKDEIVELVNQKTNSFEFKEMSSIEQAIFLVAYVEFKTMKTPKNIIINEMVEYAKVFGSKSSSKLVNAILDKII